VSGFLIAINRTYF